MYTPEKIFRSQDEYHITINDTILRNDRKLRKEVKKVIEVIVGLLKDKVEANESPSCKRIKTNQYTKST
jgi:hypothetical protein